MFSMLDFQASRAARDGSPAAPDIIPIIRREAQAKSDQAKPTCRARWR
jgi:hypothetical protein